MLIHSGQLIRCGLALLTGVVPVGCKDDGDITDPGAIALSLNPTSASVVQGGTATTTATLTRSGGFTGGVTLNVTGVPAGVTAAVSNIQTSGLVTTATVTVTVGAAVAAGTYPLVVRGSGTGVTEATANFSLVVTGPPAGVTVAFRCFDQATDSRQQATGNRQVSVIARAWNGPEAIRDLPERNMRG